MLRRTLFVALLATIAVIFYQESRIEPRFQFSTLAGLAPNLSLPKVKSEVQNKEMASIEESVDAELTGPETPLMSHHEKESFQDWAEYFRGLKEEPFSSPEQMVYMGTNEEGLSQYVTITKDMERIVHWYDEGELSVEEVISGEESLSRFYDLRRGEVDLVQWKTSESTLSMEFGEQGAPRHFWVKEKGKPQYFYQFDSWGVIQARFYQQGDSNWMACPETAKSCRIPDFYQSQK